MAGLWLLIARDAIEIAKFLGCGLGGFARLGLLVCFLICLDRSLFIFP